MAIEFELNGKRVRTESHPLRRLLDVLREELGQISVKEGCGEGECGACSVLLDGELAVACLVPVGAAAGARIVTAEGLRDTGRGRCLIDAFSDSGAVQCGFCLPGMLLAAEALLARHPEPGEEAIREAISGNLCRCTGYDAIARGIRLAAERGRGLWGRGAQGP
jgi:carbon-monoxide dehydrogenase small subunit